jgi:hypothetical protein
MTKKRFGIHRSVDYRRMYRIKKLIQHLPRSQAIYGSLVETLGPYSQYYTKTIFNY